jgi:hypothetical protein
MKNMIKRFFQTAILLSLAVGCTHQPTVQEISQKHETAAEHGRQKFSDELVAGNAAWYVTSAAALKGLNVETGLPEQLVSSSADEPMVDDFVKGHNDAILNYMAQNGPIPGSFKRYENDLAHQAAYFEAHQVEKPDTLKIGGSPVSSPDGMYSLSLRASGRTSATITTSSVQLVVSGPGGEHQSPAPAGATGNSADVLFGETGSNLAFTKWSGGGQAIYAAIDLRNGRWLVVQNGSK